MGPKSALTCHYYNCIPCPVPSFTMCSSVHHWVFLPFPKWVLNLKPPFLNDWVLYCHTCFSLDWGLDSRFLTSNVSDTMAADILTAFISNNQLNVYREAKDRQLCRKLNMTPFFNQWTATEMYSHPAFISQGVRPKYSEGNLEAPCWNWHTWHQSNDANLATLAEKKGGELASISFILR